MAANPIAAHLGASSDGPPSGADPVEAVTGIDRIKGFGPSMKPGAANRVTGTRSPPPRLVSGSADPAGGAAWM